jgi:rhodanese-related sulfurtransferase
MMKIVDVKTLKQWLANNEVVLIDVREPQEYVESNIPQAKLIPLGIITRDALPELSGKKLVIHCRSGKRSATACEKLISEDPTLDIYNLEGGILAWN